MTRLFECEQPRGGRILIRFNFDGGPFEIDTTYMFEPLVDLCRAIRMMLKGASDAAAHLFEEPGAWRVRLQRNSRSDAQEQVIVTLLHWPEMSKDWKDESGSLHGRAEVTLHRFARDIAFGLQQAVANVDSEEDRYWHFDRLGVSEIFNLLRTKSVES